MKDLEFEKPSCLVEALNCTPLKGARTTNQCEEPQAEMRRPALGQRGSKTFPSPPEGLVKQTWGSIQPLFV